MLPSLSKSMPSVDTGDAFMLESISIFAKLSESSKMYPSVLIPLFFNIEIIFCQSDGNLVPQGPLHGFIITYLIVPGYRSFLFENNIPLRVAWLKIWDYNYSYCLLERPVSDVFTIFVRLVGTFSDRSLVAKIETSIVDEMTKNKYHYKNHCFFLTNILGWGSLDGYLKNAHRIVPNLLTKIK